jgi:hypothetical protein
MKGWRCGSRGLPGAKQIEWIQYGGILEPVTLESSARIYISDVTINAVPGRSRVPIDCSFVITSREAEEKEAVPSAAARRPATRES